MRKDADYFGCFVTTDEGHLRNPRDWKIECSNRREFEECLGLLSDEIFRAKKRKVISSNDTYESDLEARYEKLADEYLKFCDAEDESFGR